MPSKKRVILNFGEVFPLWSWKEVAHYLGIDKVRYEEGTNKKLKVDHNYKKACSSYISSHFNGNILQVRDKPHFKEKNRPYLKLRKNHSVIDEATRPTQAARSLEDALTASMSRIRRRVEAPQGQSREAVATTPQSFSEHYLEQLQRLVGSGSGGGGSRPRNAESQQVQGNSPVLDVGVAGHPSIRRRPSAYRTQASRVRSIPRVDNLWPDTLFNNFDWSIPRASGHVSSVTDSQADDGGETPGGAVSGEAQPTQAASSDTGQQGIHFVSHQFVTTSGAGEHPQVLAGDSESTGVLAGLDEESDLGL